MQKRLQLYRGVYCVYWREGAKPVRRSLGTSDRTEALMLFDQFERLTVLRKRPTVTVADCWHAYQTYLGKRPAATTMGFEGRALLPVLGRIPAAVMKPDDVEAYIARRRDDGRKPGTILTELNRLAAALNHATKTGVLDLEVHVPRVPAPPPKDRYLTRDEAQRLLASVVFPHARLAIILCLTTAARVSAVLELVWDRIDMERRLIHLAAPEPGRRMKGRAIVPINDTAYAALLAVDHKQGPVVSWAGEPVKSIKKTLARAAGAAGLEDVTPHVLRHTAAVWMAEAGVPMPEISQYLGHTSTAVTEKVYARFSPQYLRKAASALELVF